MSSAVGIALIASGHAGGGPVARGGSSAITAALAAVIESAGGSIETGRRVRDLGELPATDAVVLDLDPRGVVELAGTRLPERVRRAYTAYRYGPGSFKLDLAVEGGVPWRDEACRHAGTVHVGGELDQIAFAEREINRGRMPERPFVLVCQQYLADPSRSAGDVHPVWAYAHVPAYFSGDATGAILDQIERFAPGLRERIAGSFARTPLDFADYNPNWPGGDISAGANSPLQTVTRPRPGLRPYDTGIPGVFICSSSTPPGGGVHGMCGKNAADAVLAALAA
jgi:phytoene dehydrogenase-like protein